MVVLKSCELEMSTLAGVKHYHPVRDLPARNFLLFTLSCILSLSATFIVRAQSAPAAPPSPAVRDIRSESTQTKTTAVQASTKPSIETLQPVPSAPATLPPGRVNGTSDVSSVQPIPPLPSKAAMPVAGAIFSMPRTLRPPAPPSVITVVHRLDGWKLMAWLASKRSPVIEIEDLPLAPDVHTNIVAGFVNDDGRTVIARLGQAEAEAEAAAFPPPEFAIGGNHFASDANLMVVRGDGQKFKARFVGLDGSTGLSLLEVVVPIASPAPLAILSNASIGERVRLFAPAPVRVSNRPAPPINNLLLNMSEAEGQLINIKRAPSGNVVQTIVRSRGLTPAWAGAVATNQAGALVGIVTQSGPVETRLLPAVAVRGAAARVLARRASAPQAWLGARGSGIAKMALEEFVSRGWPNDTARTLAGRNRGVLLTAVVPGTPAAQAGLRTGDVIARVSEHELFGVEDFSLLLKEAGSGSTLDFTVLRALENAPLKMSVKLSESLDPAFSTMEAEVRAAERSIRAHETEMRVQEVRTRLLVAKSRAAEAQARLREKGARRTSDPALLMEAREDLARAEKSLLSAQKQLDELVKRLGGITERVTRTQRHLTNTPLAHGAWTVMPQLIDGLGTIAISPKIAARFNARQGLLVTLVRPESVAALSGLRTGDVIESVDGLNLLNSESMFSFFRDAKHSADLDIVRDGKKLTLKVQRSISTK